MAELMLIAVGGNSLIRAGQRGTIAEQRANAAATARSIVRLIRRGHAVVITHGNGPQVGAQLLRSELTADSVMPEPLDVCGADTQGAIGYLLEQALETALAEAGLPVPVVTIVTQTVVRANDPAFQRPTKPVGPFYGPAEAARHEREEGWRVVEDSARGFRRVVPSPEPCAIIEINAIRELVRDGYVVIAAGGGGIPVVRHNDELAGVDAVIDKDLASSLLAIELGAKRFIISTDVDHIYLNYKQPGQQALERVSAAELEGHYRAGQFPPGSMGPKVLAALRFLRAGGHEAIITTPDRLLEAVIGREGTHIVPGETLVGSPDEPLDEKSGDS